VSGRLTGALVLLAVLAGTCGSASALEFVPDFGETYLTSPYAEAVAIGDVTGDGRKDVLLTTRQFNDGKLWLFEQHGDGTLERLAAFPIHPVLFNGGGVAVGDVTGDGRADGVVATFAGVELLRQSPSGGLRPAELIASSPTQASQIELGDFNGDGLNDLLVDSPDVVGGGEEENPPTYPGEGIVLMLADGTGGFTRSTVSAAWLDEIEAVDLNRDGRLDVVGVNSTGADPTAWGLRVLLQRSDGSFAAQLALNDPYIWLTGLGAGDVTADGRPDIVVAHGGPYRRVAVYPQQPDGSFSTQVLVAASESNAHGVEVTDVDRDGQDDVVVVHDGDIGVFVQEPDGTLAPEQLFRIASTSHFNPKGLAVGDFNSDRFPDVAVGEYDAGLNVIRQAPPPNAPPDCAGAFARPDVLLPATGRLREVRIVSAPDPDGDGVEVAITGVTQDEPVTGLADRTSPDAALARDPAIALLRAERMPLRDGRVYRVAFTATDDRGGECQGSVAVSVPRKKRRSAVDSAPPSYDSLAP
jgi:hypothetical protein